MSAEKLTVFVSSTSKDLADYRAVALHTILAQGWHPIMMEHFGPLPGTTVRECVDTVQRCDLVLLLVAHRRGYVPTPEQGGNGSDSITSLEIQAARDANIPILALMARDDWPGDQWEDDGDARRYVRSFRENLNQPAQFFGAEVDPAKPVFQAMVREALVRHRESILQAKPEVEWQAQWNQDSLPLAVEDLRDGSVVPFVGPGIYEEGPLSSKRLSLALTKDLGRKSPPPLATAAEYLERLGGSRERLILRFSKVIEEQEQELGTCNTYDLLANLKKQRFIVATTYDRLFERTLDEKGRAYVVIKHVIRSWEGEHDGKILVLRKAAPPQLCLADEVELPSDELVIYRPLGSPFRDEGVSENLEIDTLVVTETDHLMFLGRLENQHTKIPTALYRFMRKPFLFLGYALEAWHYRLVAQVFQQLGPSAKRAGSIFAVRKPASRIEDLAWKRLGVDVIHATPDQFVTAAVQSPETGGAVESV